MPNSANGLGTTSIPTTSTQIGSPTSSPRSRNNGLENLRRSGRVALKPRCSPEGYGKPAQLDPTACEQKSTEKNNAKIFAIFSRSRIDVHFCFGSDGARRSKTQPAIPGPTEDCPRIGAIWVRAILSTTLDDLARASFPAHMGHASSCAVHIGGDSRARPCVQA